MSNTFTKFLDLTIWFIKLFVYNNPDELTNNASVSQFSSVQLNLQQLILELQTLDQIACKVFINLIIIMKQDVDRNQPTLFFSRLKTMLSNTN